MRNPKFEKTIRTYLTYGDMLNRIYTSLINVSHTEANFKNNLKRYLKDMEVDLINQYDSDHS